MSSKKLVAYFSYSGVTRSVAQTLADAVAISMRSPPRSRTPALT